MYHVSSKAFQKTPFWDLLRLLLESSSVSEMGLNTFWASVRSDWVMTATNTSKQTSTVSPSFAQLHSACNQESELVLVASQHCCCHEQQPEQNRNQNISCWKTLPEQPRTSFKHIQHLCIGSNKRNNDDTRNITQSHKTRGVTGPKYKRKHRQNQLDDPSSITPPSCISNHSSGEIV